MTKFFIENKRNFLLPCSYHKFSQTAKSFAMSTKLFDIIKQLDRFLASDATTTLLKESNGITGSSIIEAHVQKRRLCPGYPSLPPIQTENNQTNCINIVNVAVAETNRRKGLFKDFLELLEGLDYRRHLGSSSSFYVRVDQVMNPVLDDFLPRKGYNRARSDGEPHYSYFKTVPS
jgi:hypothetical protein